MHDPPNKMHLEFNFQKEIQQTICLKAQVNTISQRQAQYWKPENKLAIEMNIFIFEISFCRNLIVFYFYGYMGQRRTVFSLRLESMVEESQVALEKEHVGNFIRHKS